MAEHLRQLTARGLAFARPILPRAWRRDIPLVPVIRLSGVIGLTAPLRPGLSLATLARTLDRAFGVRRAQAVALVINSPGGSAVQSHLIFRRIRELADEKRVPVIAFVEDVAASGGYMIACAADEIVCDPASIVGSIGVIGAGFGFPEAMRKLGIERRIYTSGSHKSMLDPFVPEKEEDVQRLLAIQRDIHELFIGLVRSRRGKRLVGPEQSMFSGEYWVAGAAKAFGLVNLIGDLRSFLRQRFGSEVMAPLIGTERTLLGRRVPGVDSALSRLFAPQGWDRAGLAEEIISAIEARAMWSRYGL